MKSAFARRQARKIGQDENEDSGGGQLEVESQDHEQSPTVIRPPIASRGSGKINKRSSLRTSRTPGGTSMIEDDDDSGQAVFTPKRPNLNRQAIEKNALRKSFVANIADKVPLRQSDDRPSYSTEYLNELRTSTPSTPKNSISDPSVVHPERKALDLATKFGSDLIVQESSSAIPSDAEIREKKERRARLAKEQDFISLHDEEGNDVEEEDDESNDERSLLPYAQQKPAQKEETRLVRDDEDIAEGFDEFVSDGRIALGKKAEREQKRLHDAEIRDMIDQAEGGASDDSSKDESEVERKVAYEAAQTKKGMEGLHKDEGRIQPRRRRTPPKITPLPTMSGCVEKLKEQLAAKQYSIGLKQRRLEEINEEKEAIITRQEEVQRLLKETGDRYEKLRAEADMDNQATNGLDAGAMVKLDGIEPESVGNG